MADLSTLVEAGGREAEIVGLSGSWGSGLAILDVKHPDGKVAQLYADNGPLIRALDAAFGCITEGHAFDA